MWLMMCTFFPVLSTMVNKNLKTKPVVSETTCLHSNSGSLLGLLLLQPYCQVKFIFSIQRVWYLVELKKETLHVLDVFPVGHDKGLHRTLKSALVNMRF